MLPLRSLTAKLGRNVVINCPRRFLTTVNDSSSHLPHSSNPSNSLPSIVLLDVDGVLNCASYPLSNETAWNPKDAKLAKCLCKNKAYSIQWMIPVVDRINALAKENKIDIRWLTTWDQYAQSSIAPALGLPHFPLARIPDKDIAKLDAATAIARENPDKSIIWVDDDLPYFFVDQRVTKEMVVYWATRRHVHFVVPRLEIGLQPNHFEDIAGFQDRVVSNKSSDLNNNFALLRSILAKHFT